MLENPNLALKGSLDIYGAANAKGYLIAVTRPSDGFDATTPATWDVRYMISYCYVSSRRIGIR